MRAILFDSGQQVRLDSLSDPAPGPGEVLIRVRASGICHTDLEILRGNYGTGALPLVPGHEYAGEVLSCGAGVSGFAQGERVVVDPNIGCGHCAGCQAGRINLCSDLGAYGVTRHGGFAELCLVRADKLHPVGQMDLHLAALAEPMGCVLNGLSALEGRRIGKALVFGAGPIGLLMALALRDRGTADVTLTDPDTARLDLAASFGLTVLHPGSDELSRARGACDLAADVTGRPEVAGALTGYLANGGAGLFFGVCPQPARIEISPFEMFRRQLSLFGTHSLNIGHIPAALAVIGRIGPDLSRLVTHRMGLEEIAEVFRSPAPAGAMKVHLSL